MLRREYADDFARSFYELYAAGDVVAETWTSYLGDVTPLLQMLDGITGASEKTRTEPEGKYSRSAALARAIRLT